MNFKPKNQRGQGIVRISDLFKKYTDTLKAPQKTVVKTFIAVVKDLFGVMLREDQCTFSVASRTLSVRVSGPLKSEIMLHKKKILELVVVELGEKSAIHEIL